MKSFQELMSIYQQEHRSKINKLMHYIGIPAIIFGIFIVLNWVNLDFGTMWKISFSWLILIVAVVYYFMLAQYKIATITTIVLVIILLIASWVAGPYPTTHGVILFVIFFFGGWIFLFVGSGMEKTKAAVIKSLWQIMIAPLFLVDELLGVCGLGSQFISPNKSSSKKSQPDLERGPTTRKPDDGDDDRQG